MSTETRERVEQAIDELGYSPDPTGRALAGQRLDAIGIVFPDLAGPYYSSVLLGAEAASVVSGVQPADPGHARPPAGGVSSRGSCQRGSMG